MRNREQIDGVVSTLTYQDAVRQFPFLKILEPFIIKSDVHLTADSKEFRNHSLIENESEAIGHGSLRQELYVLRDNKLETVNVQRSPVRIYGPAYLHPDVPDDEYGQSETVDQALSRQDLHTVTHAVLYRQGSEGLMGIGRSASEGYFDEVFIVQLSQPQK